MTDNERRELTAAELDLVVGAASDGLPIESISIYFAGSSHSRGVSRGVACDGIGACIPGGPRAERVRELRDDELENVSGGAVINEDPDALALLSFKDGVRTAREGFRGWDLTKNHACGWRKIMNKTNDTEKTRELTEAELDAVSGGGAFVKWNFRDGWPTHLRVAGMEKIMSKRNDTTKTRELTEAELAAVSGGAT